MGTDIRVRIEVRQDGAWKILRDPVPDYLGDRRPLLFHFLTGGAVERGVPRPWLCRRVLPEPRGYPRDASREVREYARCVDSDFGVHSASYLTLAELGAADYDVEFPSLDGGETTWRAILGEEWFSTLADLGRHGAPDDVRIVFDFNS